MTRRDVWLGLVSVFVGPLIGGLTLIAAVSVIAVMMPGNPMTATLTVGHWPGILAAGYVVGAIPGLVFAVTMAILSRHLLRRWQRLLVAAILGAVVSAGLLALVVFGRSLAGLDLVVLALLGATGAMAGLISLGIVELFQPLTAPAKAVP
jgi:hypothetical protein